MSSAVLDASAVIAVLRNETGADFVQRHLAGALVSSVNLAEVLYLSEQRGLSPDVAFDAVERLQLEHVPFDDDQAKLLAKIHTATTGGNIGFADRACLALGMSKCLPVIAGDREWQDYDTGVEVLLFR